MTADKECKPSIAAYGTKSKDSIPHVDLGNLERIVVGRESLTRIVAPLRYARLEEATMTQKVVTPLDRQLDVECGCSYLVQNGCRLGGCTECILQFCECAHTVAFESRDTST